MRPLLKPAHYTSDEWFERESSRLFGKLWMLAAVKPMLAKHRDYRTLTLAGKPVVLQNHQGTIRAFSNVCRHRMARIQNEEFGNRALVCSYHHWCYGEQGELIHTHRDPAVFGITREETADIRLQQYAVATIGSLVFVNLDPDPLPITEQFDQETIELLERYTGRMDSSFIYTRYNGDFNWKTGMENIKDPLHVTCLHNSTFPEYFRVNISGSARINSRDSEYLPCTTSLSQATIRSRVTIDGQPAHDWQQSVHRLDSRGFYQTFHLFPNVNLMIVDGSSFAIQVYNPLSARQTEVQMMVALTQPEKELSYKPVVLWEHLKSDMVVLQEDIECLEALQKNLESEGGLEFIHGAYEMGILDFQAAYLAQMEIGEVAELAL
ncbi:aromatic ring-hydroxylating oxygenase subunit alpha [Paraburkholderia youngii]|uniref:aromatic ring-hydroxylating oxygenase subunit alpha n=1 Tax=Paraburkholderia youngii TaxID=2782701 RepID=UPI003D1B6F58